MFYTVVLLDRKGNESPELPCGIHGNSTELKIDAELSYKYINSSHIAHIIDHHEIVSRHSVLGYSFFGDAIINGVSASRYGHYILILSIIS